MRLLGLLLAIVFVAGVPAAAETGTWGVSGAARLAPEGPGPHRFLRLEQAVGATLGARPGVLGTASISDLAVIAITCSTTQRPADGSWRLIAYGVGTDGAGYRIDLSLDPDLAMTNLQVSRGGPDTCDVGNPSAVWTGYQGQFFAGEGGGVRLEGDGVTAAGIRLEAELTVVPYTARGLGTVLLTRGATTEQLRALCVVMTTPRPRATRYQLLAASEDGVVYDIHIGDEDRWTTSGDGIVVDIAGNADALGQLGRSRCSTGSSTAPQPLIDGDFVTRDLV